MLPRGLHESVTATISGSPFTTKECYHLGPAYRSLLTCVTPALAVAYALSNSNIPGGALTLLRRALSGISDDDYREQATVFASFLDAVSLRVLSRLRLVLISAHEVAVFPSSARADLPTAHTIFVVLLDDGSVRLAWARSDRGSFVVLCHDSAWAAAHTAGFTPPTTAAMRRYPVTRSARDAPLADRSARAAAKLVVHPALHLVSDSAVHYMTKSWTARAR